MTTAPEPPPLPSSSPEPVDQAAGAASGWHYSRAGERRGPVTIEVLRQLLSAGELAPTDLVWKPGMAAWVPAAAGIATDPRLPPPLPGPAVGNHAAWLLVVGLPIAFIVALTIVNLRQTADTVAWDGLVMFCALAAAVALVTIDIHRLKRAGYQVDPLARWAFILLPAYLFKRSRLLRQGQALFTSNLIIIALLALLVVVASAEKASPAAAGDSKAPADEASLDQQAPVDVEPTLTPVQKRDADVKALLKAMDDQGESQAAIMQMNAAVNTLEAQGDEMGMGRFNNVTEFYPTFAQYKELFIQIRNDQREVRKAEAERLKSITPAEKRSLDERDLLQAVSGGGLEETRQLIQQDIQSLEGGDVDAAIAMFNNQLEQHAGLAGFKEQFLQLANDERAVRADPSYHPAVHTSASP